MKEWVASNQKHIIFKLNNKVIVKIHIEYSHECCKKRFVVFHELELQRNILQDEVLAIVKEESKEEVAALRRHFEAHIMNVIEVSLE